MKNAGVPLVVAHRGSMHEAPENTRSAFDAALRYPVYGLELDIQMTSDGVPVLYHDSTLRKITGSRKNIAEYSFAQLKNIDWGGWFSPEYKGEKLMTLKKALQLYAARTALMIEIKSRRFDRKSGRSIILTHKVLELISEEVKSRFLDNIYILSFDINILRSAHETAPDLKYVMNIGGSRRIPKKINEAPGILSGICLPVSRLDKQSADAVRESGMLLMTYTCNLKRQAEKALSLNADIVMTNKPGWFFEHIRNRAAR